MSKVDSSSKFHFISDGILLLRFIEGHAGAIVARELTNKLFTDYLDQVSSYPIIEGRPTKKVSWRSCCRRLRQLISREVRSAVV